MDIEWRQIEQMDVPKEYSEETSFAFSTSDWKANGICGYSERMYRRQHSSSINQ